MTAGDFVDEIAAAIVAGTFTVKPDFREKWVGVSAIELTFIGLGYLAFVWWLADDGAEKRAVRDDFFAGVGYALTFFLVMLILDAAWDRYTE